jgi:predicted nucleic acid-binding protein
MIVLDSDVLSALMREDSIVAAWLDRQPVSSVWTTTITIFEIRFGLYAMPASRRRVVAEAAFDEVLERDLARRVLPFDYRAADEAAQLMALRSKEGRMKESRDTMIAGIALASNATLATRNVRHFDDLRVPVVNPWQK